MATTSHLEMPETGAPALPDWPERAVIQLRDEAATDALALRLSRAISPGDTLLLSGHLGAGKTHLARALIRALMGDGAEKAPIPSPTFTLVQTYDTARGEVWHADLYRLGDFGELTELGLDEALGTAITLIEWPDRLAPDWPVDATLLHLDRQADDTRTARLMCAQSTRLLQAMSE